ncbi:sensor histidine kinase [Luteimonas soli]|uniref:Sensor histidine kinase n=1 Tax=Luteimonas soli TaxID=1648966 RepID=A0ABV7XNU7_9GAMM
MPDHRPLEALFRPPALITVVLAGEALALMLALASGRPGARMLQFGLASLGIQWVAVGTLCMLYLLRRPLSRLTASVLAWVCLGLLLAMTLLVASAAWALLDLSAGLDQGALSFMLRMLGIALVVGLLALMAFQNYSEATRLAVRAKQSELEALQARVRPHFLFNTLNSGIALVRQRPEQAEELLLGLSDLFRAALARPHDVALGEELALVRRYLEIEAVRFGPRLRVTWRLPEPLPELAVPALSVQALVENAVRHGIERSPEGGGIDIEVAVEGDEAVIEVRNALGTAGNDDARAGHSIGLQATRARVQASTGGRGSVESGREGEAFVARMRLPVG